MHVCPKNDYLLGFESIRFVDVQSFTELRAATLRALRSAPALVLRESLDSLSLSCRHRFTSTPHLRPQNPSRTQLSVCNNFIGKPRLKEETQICIEMKKQTSKPGKLFVFI